MTKNDLQITYIVHMCANIIYGLGQGARRRLISVLSSRT